MTCDEASIDEVHDLRCSPGNGIRPLHHPHALPTLMPKRATAPDTERNESKACGRQDRKPNLDSKRHSPRFPCSWVSILRRSVGLHLSAGFVPGRQEAAFFSERMKAIT